ncbi:MAG: hypothetical protein ABSH52_15295 [Terriglobia bacterium]
MTVPALDLHRQLALPYFLYEAAEPALNGNGSKVTKAPIDVGKLPPVRRIRFIGSV